MQISTKFEIAEKLVFEIRNEKNANSFNQQRFGQFALFGCHKWRFKRAIKTNLHSNFVSYSTVASFKHLRREEEASIGHTQFSAGKREE